MLKRSIFISVLVGGAILGIGTAYAQTYSVSDVSTRNTASNCWLIISGKVYNMTNFITQHPGGKSAIINNCGKDATNAFVSKGGKGGHSSYAYSLLPAYFIGNVGSTNASSTVGATSTAQIPAVPVPIATSSERRKEWKLSIEENGNVLLRGVVDSVASGTIKIRSWGGLWTVNAVVGAELLPWRMEKGIVDLSHFTQGDFVGVQGKMHSDGSMTINAKVLRNRTDKQVIKYQTQHRDDDDDDDDDDNRRRNGRN